MTTDEEYFEMFGRRVTGTVKSNSMIKPPPPPGIVLVLWEHQEGEVIPEHSGNVVFMLTRNLRRVKEEEK